MVLTRLMATTNNAQGDKPRLIALERQVQTLTTAMECLTKKIKKKRSGRITALKERGT